MQPPFLCRDRRSWMQISIWMHSPKLSGKVTIPLGGNMFQILIVLYDNTTSEEIDFIYSDNFGSYILHAPAGEYFVSVGEGSPLRCLLF